MILGKIELTEQSDLEFGLEIQGTIEKTSSIRFVIEGPDFDVSCKCKENSGTVTAIIPKLKGILPSGVYESRLEIIIDGKIFTPLRESIELNPLVEFGLSKPALTQVKEGVKFKVKTPIVAKESHVSSRDKQIQLAIAEGFELVKVKNFDVLKKDNMYHGIVSESNVVFSDRGFDSLSSLVEELSK
jgi:hypothetical protein